MAPLSVPVDIPAQNKVEPIPMGLQNDPQVLPTATEERKISGLGYDHRSFSYSEARDELFVEESTTIGVYAGLDGSLLRTLTISVGTTSENYGNSICVIGGEIFIRRSGANDIVDVYDILDSSLQRTLDFSSETSGVFSIAEAEGNLLLKFANSIVTADIINGDILESVSAGSLLDGGKGPIFINGNLVVTSRLSADSFDTYLNVYEGISDTLLGRVNIQAVVADASASVNLIPEATRTFSGADRVTIYIFNGSTNNVDIVTLDYDVTSENYVITSTDELVEGNIYFLDIPYGTTDNRINVVVDGTSYPVISRTGAFIPDYALQGLTPLYFKDGAFRVITLSRDFASEIYGFTIS